MRETVIVDAVRTPVGKRNGGLSTMHAADLSAVVLQRTRRPHRHRPGARRRRGLGLCVAGRRPVQQHRTLFGACRGVARDDPGDDDQPGVRLEPAGAGLRGAGGDVGTAGCRRRGRCRGDEPGAARRRAGHRHAVRPESACALWGFLVQPGTVCGDDRAEVGILAHPARRVFGAVSRAGRRRPGRGAFDAQIVPVFRTPRRSGGRRRGRAAREPPWRSSPRSSRRSSTTV